ncbi:MAG: hypothetical protein CMM89_04895 [Rickettsiales bacterium]|nr:hypothetical protein [Rickettsiales bacterium]OUT44148.1 MAG: hypothetical protein CBB73_04790 [Pelagibacteraceae bacterium TMED13]
MNFFYLVTLLLFSTSIQANVKVNSIIKLKENIPEECGLSFSNQKEKFTAELTIKKNDTNNTLTFFKVNSKSININQANLISFSNDIGNILDIKPTINDEFTLTNITKNDEMTMFFQEILIGNSTLIVNNKNYEIKGPIDSKVRLEYLFCTGEMFLPNYEKK